MNKRNRSMARLGLAAALLAVGIGAYGIKGDAAFDAPYCNINLNGGSFDGNYYTLSDGRVVTDSFFCDGFYTYF